MLFEGGGGGEEILKSIKSEKFSWNEAVLEIFCLGVSPVGMCVRNSLCENGILQNRKERIFRVKLMSWNISVRTLPK